jgi:Zn-dependent protease/predicted transcriptional regulator
MLLLWVLISGLVAAQSPLAAAGRVLFVLVVFATVVLHELGHALTAQRFGIRTRSITLLPIGGVASLERMPDKPLQELLVAVAGPAVNVAIAIVLFAALTAAGRPILSVDPQLLDGAPFAVRLFWVNVSLAAFNLLPAFPMDGGRVLRALLAIRLEAVRATRIAARIGQGFAVVLGVFGLLANPMLAVLALFLWLAAAAEAGAAETKAALSGAPVSAAMTTDFYVLDVNDELGAVARQLVSGPRVDFPVTSDGVVVGILTRAGLIEGLANRGPRARVRDSMVRAFTVAAPDDSLETVLPRLESSASRTVPVIDRGRLVGLLTPEGVGELVWVNRALAHRGAEPA